MACSATSSMSHDAQQGVVLGPSAQQQSPDEVRAAWAQAFRRVRAETESRAALLSPEDQQVQSMTDASPAKWHRAHVTWFFETFLLRPHDPSYKIFDERFPFLFNSYYVAAGPRHARPRRGMITRPTAANVVAYRAHVDAAVEQLIANIAPADAARVFSILEIGLHHEQQHQELLLADILHAFAQNPTDPAYDPRWTWPKTEQDKGFASVPTGVRRIGHDGQGFCFDNELPAHDELIPNIGIARSLVSSADWLEFIKAGGYETPSLWLSDGWAVVQTEGWQAPGYWRSDGDGWTTMTLAGRKPVDPKAPVVHVSYYEADAFARFAGKHLPSEAEWEIATRAGIVGDAFGVAWQWTRSAYLPYPGYHASAGALGEYNGKFMVSQMVLRGSSLATPEGHARASYRNFFYPPARWQFSGVRLAEFN
jgi:ergothioneine biosynthesis protein EgtB